MIKARNRSESAIFNRIRVIGILVVILTMALFLISCASLAAFDKQPKSVFHEMAVDRTLKPTFPKYSDVSMRTLTIRDVPYEDQKNAFRAAAEFHITRIDWSYIWFTSRELQAVKKLQKIGYNYCGSAAQHVPCWIGDRALVDWQERIVMTDINGDPSVMPFIRPWKNPQLIGDISNPVYYQGHLEFYKKLIDAGCDSLQRDAADHHRLAVTICGGGFTETGIAGFTKWLAKNIDAKTLRELGVEDIEKFNYKNYLIEKDAPVGDDFSRQYKGPFKEYWYQYWEDVAIDFFTRLVRDVKAYAGWDIPFSCNNGSFQKWDALEQLFDFGISELMMVSANPDHLRQRLVICESLGKFQIIGSAKLLGLEVKHDEKTALDKKVIATLYGNGALGMVPWDTFEQTKDGSGRFFGEPADYAPIFGFIRGIGGYLGGYERAYDYSTNGILTEGVDPEHKPLEITDTDNEICAFVRVDKKAHKPIVVHLIDWGKPLVVRAKEGGSDVWELASGEKIYEYVKGMENLKRSSGEPFELVLRADAFDVPAEKLQLMLLTSRPYDEQRHHIAEKTKDYSTLVMEQKLTARVENGKIYVTIPKLDPWGVLLISKK